MFDGDGIDAGIGHIRQHGDSTFNDCHDRALALLVHIELRSHARARACRRW